ncbi:PhnB protein [Gemmobacter megaterium]|uniref:PhnB protein n=1 Tax=Gemmobacter megaterium TaxID=1086013 RepID=A0A1N7QNI6_9RHOB|nr:VOC family protein [Gemmobacter megaterium]GGE28000.1 VOC family protein [Gemmobacter megaterium]SIT24401.1 PhnB protein [Gemmobacter megaterium]
MSFDPYIHFQGNCRAALTAYQELFGGDLELMPYSAAPDWPDGTPEAMKTSDRVMHGTLRLPEGRMLMASDFPPGMGGDPQQAVSISHIAPTMERARQIFAALGDGGAVIMAFQPTFWSDGFGMVKDRFGTHWMVSAPWRN